MLDILQIEKRGRGRPSFLDHDGIVARWNAGVDKAEIAKWAGTSPQVIQTTISILRKKGGRFIVWRRTDA